MLKPSYRRRKVIVDKLQYRLIIAGILYFATVVLIFAGAVFIPVMLHIDKGGISSIEVQKAARQFLVLQERVWPPLLLAFVLLIVHSVVVSHRISGPLYRIRTVLKSVGEGDLSRRITLRSNDYMEKEAHTLNDMIGSLSGKIHRLENHTKEASANLAALRRTAQTGSNEEITRRINELATDIDELVRCLNEFKTQRDTTAHKDDTGHTRIPKSIPETVETAT